MTKRRTRSYKGKKLTTADLKTKLFKIFLKNPKKRYNASQLSKKIHASNSKDSVQHMLNELEKESKIWMVKEGKYRLDKFAGKEANSKLPKKAYVGKVDLIRSGAAYVIIDNLDEDVYIPAKHINGAMHGDIVKVSVAIRKGKKKQEGKIKEIQERAVKQVLGTLKTFAKHAIVYSDMHRVKIEVNVNPEDYAGAKDDDKVIVQIESYGKSQNKSLWGKVIKVMKDISRNDYAMNSILMENGFEIDFPEEVMKEAEGIPDKIQPSDYEGRRDCREVLTITIDPDTAKDFDDALSYRVLDNGHIEVGVHIADVTHYVLPGTEIDKEALHRSTSVYLVDRVAPMLPEKLSNNLCSLVPHEDRLTFAAIFEFDKDLKIVNKWFGKSIIHSDRRFTYEEAQEIIENKEGEFADEILMMQKIAEHLRKKKFKNGAIAFESEEVKFKLDENAVPVGVYVKERKDAHLLIEDFMLLANKEVAIYMAEKEKVEIPFVYRTHDVPNQDKLLDFKLFALELGVKLNIDTPKQIASSFNKLTKEAADNEALKMLMPLAIRTMAKAEYSTENIGHYGLAFSHYAHFTSPIRRYADVLVHRILYNNLKETKRMDKSSLDVMCSHISSKERDANSAERDSIKYKKVEYMLEKIGEEFDGQVSGMIERGIFVEISESNSEGFIPFENMEERYAFGDSKLVVKSKESGHTIKMGDPIKVRLVSADLDERRIELEIITEI
jgi:ribonuclease R